MRLPRSLHYLIGVAAVYHVAYGLGADLSQPEPPLWVPTVVGGAVVTFIWWLRRRVSGPGWRKSPGIVVLQFVRYSCRGFAVSSSARDELRKLRRNAAWLGRAPAEVLELWVLVAATHSAASILSGSFVSKLLPSSLHLQR